jgi:hypothetical protein
MARLDAAHAVWQSTACACCTTETGYGGSSGLTSNWIPGMDLMGRSLLYSNRHGHYGATVLWWPGIKPGCRSVVPEAVAQYRTLNSWLTEQWLTSPTWTHWCSTTEVAGVQHTTLLTHLVDTHLETVPEP